ncbi:MAG: DUF1566 domain-containing protein [Myxococcaceae bacterium]|nr:DUF1566 domain-containing protein [Myxococcaceae bacterium]
MNLTWVNNTIPDPWAQLFENRSLTQVDAEVLSGQGVRGVLEALSPQIKAQPDYTGTFVANCSLYLNTMLERVSCNISSSEGAMVPFFANQTRLPEGHASEITRSHIVLLNIYADWTGKTSVYDENFAMLAYPRTATCSVSSSNTLTKLSPTRAQNETESFLASSTRTKSGTPRLSQSDSGYLSESSTLTCSVSSSDTLTKPSLTIAQSETGSFSAPSTRTKSRTLRLSQSDSHDLSVSSSLSPGNSWTNSLTESLSLSLPLSSSSTLSLSPSLSCTIPQGSEWSQWAQIIGVYANLANQGGRYSVSNGVVTDSYTGLRWQQTGSTGAYPWSAFAAAGSAQAYCASQATGGFNHWRLPTRIELQTLVDYTTSSPSIDTTTFPGTQSSSYWTSTVYAPSPSVAWRVYFDAGHVGTGSISGAGYVRCVR